MPAIAPPLAIPPEDLGTLGQWSRSGSIRAALAERARILLLAAEGLSNGLVESVNTKIRLLTRIAFGFRSPDALIGLAMLTVGGLCPPLPGR